MEFTKLIGTGYGAEPNEFIWLQENVVNMWSGKPIGAFTYFAEGHTHFINVCIRVSKVSWKTVLVTEKNVNENIKNLVEEKYNIKL